MNLIDASVNFGVECVVSTSSNAIDGKGRVPVREEMVPQQMRVLGESTERLRGRSGSQP